MILEDVRKQSERERRERREKRRMRRYKRECRDESSSDDSDETSVRSRPKRFSEIRCRDDSGREDNGREDNSARSPVSTNSSVVRPYPTYAPSYDELVEKVKEMEREKEVALQLVDAVERRMSEKKEREKKEKQRWKTASSDSDEF